jgi:glycosyltransferase involved in cell wall biosynthesis
MNETIYFIVPGSLATRTGGYVYDRRIIEYLRSGGWTVEPIELGGNFPDPDDKTRANAEKFFASIPGRALVVVDGLAFGVLPEIAEKEHVRLALFALVHHPLADETGIAEDLRQKLMRSEAIALRFANHAIVTSKFTRRRLVELGISSGKISIVEPGVVPAPLAGRRDEGGRGPPIQMLCPASYIARKGHADLLFALSGLIDLPWHVICVGNSELDTRCFAKVCALREELGLAARVELRTEVEDRELESLYGASNLIVLASRYEGFGMVVTEAIARGLPIITTTGGALAETLPKGAGLASPPGDIDALKKNLRHILEDENLFARLSKGAQAARERLRTWDEASRAFAAVLSA